MKEGNDKTELYQKLQSTLYSYIDRIGKPLVKFRKPKDSSELKVMKNGDYNLVTSRVVRYMKVGSLLIIAALFAACSHQSVNNKADDRQDSVTVSQDNSNENDDGHVCMSEDGCITIESGMHPNGGTSPDYWTVWTIKDNEDKKHKIKSPTSSYQDKIHCLSKNDGTTYYIVNCYDKASSSDGYEWLEAYKIVGDTVERVNVVDGSSPYREDDRFSVNYDIPSWYFATNGAGYDWILEYDIDSKELYVPITTENNDITDRYKVWRFEGERFVYQGERPNRHLHSILSQYDRLLQYITTKDYTVRVDMLANGELRYSSWNKTGTTNDYPDIVLTGGKKVHYEVALDQLPLCDEYRFKNGNCQYIVNHCEVGRDENGNGVHHDYLMVTSKGKVLFKQEIKK